MSAAGPPTDKDVVSAYKGICLKRLLKSRAGGYNPLGFKAFLAMGKIQVEDAGASIDRFHFQRVTVCNGFIPPDRQQS